MYLNVILTLLFLSISALCLVIFLAFKVAGSQNDTFEIERKEMREYNRRTNERVIELHEEMLDELRRINEN